VRVPSLVPPGLSHGVARGIPDTRDVELAGRDHLFCTGDQGVVLDEIERFLTGRLTRRPSIGCTQRWCCSPTLWARLSAPRRWGNLRWRDVLERHDRLVKREVGRYRSRDVKSTGDGLLATFDGPARAVRAGTDDLGGIGVRIAARIQAPPSLAKSLYRAPSRSRRRIGPSFRHPRRARAGGTFLACGVCSS
jgi:hypothetical protein